MNFREPSGIFGNLREPFVLVLALVPALVLALVLVLVLVLALVLVLPGARGTPVNLLL